ncbi:MAG TPA: hypothetical protein VKP69_21640 [Isosphaeraceae bacterium]|nr:hypothetical protein [Isosphaeraceae bacterium]
MLKPWGLDASEHRPRQWERALCDQAEALFVMAPAPRRRLVSAFGTDLAGKTSLFTDPFSRPQSLPWGADKVCDPSFEERLVAELIQEFVWMRERVQQIRRALRGEGRGLVPASEDLPWIPAIDPDDVEIGASRNRAHAGSTTARLRRL